MPEWIDARVDQRPPTGPPKGGSVFFFRFGSWFHIIDIDIGIDIGLMTRKMKAPIHVEDLGIFLVQFDHYESQGDEGEDRRAGDDCGGLFYVDILLFGHSVLTLRGSHRTAKPDPQRAA
jgi:hypothetical protein